jgi:hypothetical protein
MFRFVLCGFLTASAVSARPQHATADPAAILKGQRDQTAQITARWLQSGDPRLQAWGAYAALRDHNTQLTSDLTALIGSYEVVGWPVPSGQIDQHDAMLAVLDAAIQLGAMVPASDVAKLYPEFPAQSLILLRRAGADANSFLLNVFRTEHSQLAWLTAGNMLAERRSQGFAAAVLGGMTVHAEIRVVSSGGAGIGTGSGGDFDPGSTEGKADWPEIGTYALVGHISGATLLVDGTDPAYYLRTVSTLYDRDRRDYSCCYGYDAESWDLIREHYLAGLLYEPKENPPLKSFVHQTILRENGEAYAVRVRSMIEGQQNAFVEVASRLENSRLMTSEEAAATRPKLEIRIVDDREDKTTPVPRVETLGENVSVKM